MTGFILGLVVGGWLFGLASFFIGCWLGYDMGKSDARDDIDTVNGDMPTLSHRMRGHPSTEWYRLKS